MRDILVIEAQRGRDELERFYDSKLREHQARIRDLKDSLAPDRGDALSVSAADRWADIATEQLTTDRIRWSAKVKCLDTEVKALTAIIGAVD